MYHSVSVDFNSRQILFHDKSISRFASLMYDFWIGIFLTVLILWLIVVSIPYLSFEIYVGSLQVLSPLGLTILFLVIPFAVSLLVFMLSLISPNYRKMLYHCSPIIFTKILTGWFNSNKKVLPIDVQNDMFIIPKFRNNYLEYELYGDFKDIKSIEIDEYTMGKGVNKDFRYYCVFTFNNPINKGYMDLKYN